jgi:uncharacterized membrane protein YidH (DUF202 family)
MMMSDRERAAFEVLTQWGAISCEQLDAAAKSALSDGVSLESKLLNENHIPKYLLNQALARHYDCPYIEYDERLPIPPDILEGLDAKVLSLSLWMPVIRCQDGTVVIAANNPQSQAVKEDVQRYLKTDRYEFRVALKEDIHWYIQDFLHAPPGRIIGTERTGLSYWRTTMAQWRTKLACYRTELAWARSGLAYLRWGLGTVAIADALLRSATTGSLKYLFFTLAILIIGLFLCLYGLPIYSRVRKSRISPPGNQTIVEVTAATILFLENYHFVKDPDISSESGKTMLARLNNFLADYCTILFPSPPSKVRTMFVHERNVLGAQRTVESCYRTIYARARTGLAFMRTGFSFITIGLGLFIYFGIGAITALDALLVLAGILMTIDGALWYLPVRREQAEIPRSIAFE